MKKLIIIIAMVGLLFSSPLFIGCATVPNQGGTQTEIDPEVAKVFMKITARHLGDYIVKKYPVSQIPGLIVCDSITGDGEALINLLLKIKNISNDPILLADLRDILSLLELSLDGLIPGLEIDGDKEPLVHAFMEGFCEGIGYKIEGII